MEKISSSSTDPEPMGLFIQPACLQHKYIRHANASHIFERPERLRAVLLGVAAAASRLEEEDAAAAMASGAVKEASEPQAKAEKDDLTSLLSSLSIASSTTPTRPTPFALPIHLTVVPPPTAPVSAGQILLHHRALQLSHTSPPEAPFPYSGPGARTSNTPSLSSSYLRDLLKWATEAPERIKAGECEIPGGLGLNQGDLYLGPGSVLAIEGAVQTVCQAVDMVLSLSAYDPAPAPAPSTPPAKATDAQSTPLGRPTQTSYFSPSAEASGSRPPAKPFRKAFCAIRPPGHHCGEDSPSGFCYVNNVVVGAMHAYLEHDVDRAIIIDFDLHHGNGTQELIMPLNAATYAEELAVKAGKPPSGLRGRDGARRRGWKGFYGSVHDIYSYPCEDGELDLIKDASLSLAAHGQYIENIHLQPYSSEDDFYARIYPKYLALLDKAKLYMDETEADPDRTIVLISAGFDACEHEHQAMQRHDRRVPVSFFSRYTRDIAAFADEYCRGRVVSVLEGGYSDRALMSAAMGHVVGMLGREGKGEWWNVDSLDHIERATKKKRTGKIAPFPSELSHIPHLSRTHALLAHFEGVGLPPDPPSTHSTPQQPPAPRMTLRARRLGGDEDGLDTPPVAARRGRGRGVGTPTSTATSTPRARKGVASPSKLAASSSAPAALAAAAGVPQSSKGVEVDEVVERMSKVVVGPSSLARTAFTPDTTSPAVAPIPLEAAITPAHSTTAIHALPQPNTSVRLPFPPMPVRSACPVEAPIAQETDVAAAKRIYLRFKRPETETPAPPSALAPPSTGLYPVLPTSAASTSISSLDRAGYREISAETSTSEE